MVDKQNSSILTGFKSNTPMDLITYRLFFIWPLTEKQVEWLNTIIYQDDLFLINYWSFTHTLFGIFWGMIAAYSKSKWFVLRYYVIFHTLFEIWELWAGGYLSGINKITTSEIVDCLMDTLFGIAGFYLGVYLIKQFV